ncbi:MAG TPA: xanthine dehydrogenase family protein molybdopterin-binding subunit [Gaiellales bacterium]
MARLVKTQVEMEGRYEDRWTLVEDDAAPEYADGDELAVVGRPHARVSAAARVSGGARFISDIDLSGMVHAAVLRSPHANARVASLDRAAAQALPGVRAVIGPGDLPDRDGRPVLTDAPAYAGAAVAAVAADTPDHAEQALAALAPEWEPLAFVVDLDEGLARQEFTEEPEETSRGDVDAALEGAAAVIEAEYRTPAQMQTPLEPHCAVAAWDSGGLTVWSSTQGIFAARDELARAYELDPDDVRVVCQYMGGGFGGKQGAGPEGYMAVELARRSGRPVRLVYTRRDEHTTAGYRAPTVQSYRIGAAADGKLVGIESSAVLGIGVHGWAFPVLNPAETLYDCANVRSMMLPVKLNLGFSNAFRAPGVMEGTFGFEQALDELAGALGIDPLEIRLRNPATIEQASGKPYTSKHLEACQRRVAELAGWNDRDSLRSDGRVRRGMGLASQIWWGGGGPPAHATVRLGKSARPTLVCGFQDIGTGTMTASAVVVAEALGVPVETVRVQAGDTARSGYGPTSGGSMTLASVAPAVRSAAHEVRTQLLDLAADMFEIAASDLVLADGHVSSRDGTLRHEITELTSKLGNASLVGHGSRGPNPDGMRINTFGCQAVQIAVDTLTGAITVEKVWAVHDVGRIINPMGAISQVTGGVLQAIGFALTEERVVDPTTGTVVNAGLEDYKVPTIADTPEIVCEFVDSPDPHLALGIKGLGEPPIIPTAAAIGNAFAHATGVRLREAPFTSQRVLEGLAG